MMIDNSIEINFQFAEPSLPQIDELEHSIHVLCEKMLPNASVEMVLLITDDKSIQKINLERRGKNTSTDVLSFPLSIPNSKLPHYHLGEIVISAETAKKQAKEIGHDVREEFYRLLVHGFLHLLGYDHELSEEDETIMKAKEDECLSLLLGN